MKNIILCQKGGFVLVKSENCYKFGSWEDFCKINGIPSSQCGTKKEIIAELDRQKRELCKSEKMMETINCFILALSLEV